MCKKRARVWRSAEALSIHRGRGPAVMQARMRRPCAFCMHTSTPWKPECPPTPALIPDAGAALVWNLVWNCLSGPLYTRANVAACITRNSCVAPESPHARRPAASLDRALQTHGDRAYRGVSTAGHDLHRVVGKAELPPFTIQPRISPTRCVPTLYPPVSTVVVRRFFTQLHRSAATSLAFPAADHLASKLARCRSWANLAIHRHTQRQVAFPR